MRLELFAAVWMSASTASVGWEYPLEDLARHPRFAFVDASIAVPQLRPSVLVSPSCDPIARRAASTAAIARASSFVTPAALPRRERPAPPRTARA
jgi:hypothetical protein